MKKLTIVFIIGGVVVLSLVGFIGWKSVQTARINQPATAPETVAPLAEHEMYLIAVDNGGDNGELVACNDSLVPVDRWVPSEGDIIANTFTDLFTQHDRIYQSTGLYNPLWQSSLRFDELSKQDSSATLRLSGTLALADHCDGLRAKAQLEATVKQFQQVEQVAIIVNGQPLESLLP